MAAHRKDVLKPSGFPEKFSFCLLWSVVFSVPWEEGVAFLGVGTLSRVLGYGVFFLMIFVALTRGSVRSFDSVHGAMFLFVFWTFLTAAWSLSFEMSVALAMTYLRVAILAWFVWELARTRERLRQLLYAYALGTIVPIVSLLYMFGMTFGGMGRYRGAGMNENDLALILAIGILITLFLLTEVTIRSLKRAWLLWILCGFQGVSIAMTGSRGGIIALGAGLSYFLASYLWRRRRSRTQIVIVLLIVLAGVYRVLPSITAQRFADTGDEFRYGTWGSRKEILAGGIEAYWNSPVLGSGSGTFTMLTEPRGLPPHNTLLAVLVEDGAVGAALFLAIVVRIVIRARRTERYEATLWFSLLITWAVGGMTLGWDSAKTTWLLFGMIAAAARIVRESRMTHAVRTEMPRGSGAIVRAAWPPEARDWRPL
jgi:O-antigen ligase